MQLPITTQNALLDNDFDAAIDRNGEPFFTRSITNRNQTTTMTVRAAADEGDGPMIYLTVFRPSGEYTWDAIPLAMLPEGITAQTAVLGVMTTLAFAS